MSSDLTTAVVSILTAVTGVAILATIVSKNSNTAGVIQAGGQAYSGILATALSPVTGGGSSVGFSSNGLSTNFNY